MDQAKSIRGYALLLTDLLAFQHMFDNSKHFDSFSDREKKDLVNEIEKLSEPARTIARIMWGLQ